MIQIEYRDKTYTGETKADVIQLLRKERLNQAQIGKLVGLSRERVSQILGRPGRLSFPELDNVITFLESDEMIAFNLNLPLSRVSAARRRLGLRTSNKVDVARRRRTLAQFLFKKLPGPNFVDFLKEQLAELDKGKSRVIEEFYVLGISQSLADNVNGDSDRVYRYLARQDLKEIVGRYSLDELIEGEVING
jgi:predicted XRE-type DNA-binding protein